MTRRIAVVTTSRADYAHLRWVLEDLRGHPAIELQLIVVGAPLAPEFGYSITEIEADGFEVTERVECLISSDSDVGMAKTIGVATLGLADALGRLRPDLLLLIADRYELLAPASVAAALRIPLAHIEGGEVSQGAIDDAVRNALTKLSHVHFTPTETARRRVLALGEESWRVHRSGAPSLDYLRRLELLESAELEQVLGLTLRDPVLVAYHPVTIARDTLREADELFSALERLERQVLFCFPNADAGSRRLFRRAERFCDGRENAHLFVNLNPARYWSLLRAASLMLGNSSSGIMETASLGLPTVNVGMRQQGRERACNVIDASPTGGAILAAVSRALDPAFRESLVGMTNPYGDGAAARRITRVLADVPLGEALLIKQPPGGADE
ncbi:MAG: UDP-N-acetylglucosamine 2-epimerase (hydrolyzing) [bacterium]|nr:UDP-N-acetylglucosamine 2-epimerase (hydrolyzing) [bacterium]